MLGVWAGWWQNKHMNNQSLQKKLNFWIIIATAGFSILAAAVSGITSFYEAKDSQDIYLTQVGDLIKQGGLFSGITTGGDEEDDETLIVQCLQSNCQKRLKIPTNISNGFYTLIINNVQWRILILSSNTSTLKKYAVAQRTEFRDEIASDTALLSFFSMLILVPFLIGLVHFIIRYNFKPVHELSQNINERNETDLTPLGVEFIPQELLPFIDSINRMFNRTETVLRQQKRFVADAAHELRTPLTALSLLNENAMQSIKKNDTQQAQQRLVSLQTGIKRMRNLVNQLLSLARIQGKSPTESQEVNLLEVTQEVVADLILLAEEKKIDIGVTEKTDLFVLDRDGGLAILIHNALDNAIRYSPIGGKIDIKISKQVQNAVLEIKDTGKGIRPEELDKVFEPFYRTSDNREQGNGLGLAISQEIAKKIKGEIILKNHHDGGLVFIYKIPIRY
jgi:signal transduction histidine kinase